MKKIVLISNTLSSLYIFRSELINKLSDLIIEYNKIINEVIFQSIQSYQGLLTAKKLFKIQKDSRSINHVISRISFQNIVLLTLISI